MRQDYGGRYSSVSGKRQKVTKRDARGAKQGRNRWVWRVTGFATMLGSVLGIIFSVWLGHQVQNSLDELALRQESLQGLKKTNRQLREHATLLQSEDRILTAARKMGLFPPTASQTKRP
jgi:cell division protein FtsB